MRSLWNFRSKCVLTWGELRWSCSSALIRTAAVKERGKSIEPRSICQAEFMTWRERSEWRRRTRISYRLFTFVPQKSYLLDRDNGSLCSQMIREQSALDNGNVNGVSPSFLIRILHGVSKGSGLAPSSNRLSRILLSVSWNTYRQLISLISSSAIRRSTDSKEDDFLWWSTC